MTHSIPQPDLSSRPHDSHAERWTPLSPTRLYRAWTQEWDLWFARPGTVVMDPQPGQPWFFEVEFQKNRHPHYGRFIRLHPGRLVETTWVTGKGGTEGAETLLTVEFIPENNGTRIKLSQRGFPHAQAASENQAAWPPVLEQQEKRLT
jgi:Activator of Hsp90 ATPase homolog 1-like protein